MPKYKPRDTEIHYARKVISDLNIFPKELYHRDTLYGYLTQPENDSGVSSPQVASSPQDVDGDTQENKDRNISIRNKLQLIKDFNISPKELYLDISQPEGDSHVSFPEPIYPTSEKRGCALIISNPFDSVDGERISASEKDVESMKWLWEEQNGCELFDIGDVDGNTDQPPDKATENTRKNLRKKIAREHPSKTYEGVTAKEMEELLMSLSETKKDYAYIVVVISTHGAMVTEEWLKKEGESSSSVENRKDIAKVAKENAKRFRECRVERKILQKDSMENNTTVEPAATAIFFGEDMAPVREREMMKLFYNDRDEGYTLKGIPKFFIFDYCREDFGADEESASDKKGKVIKDGDNNRRTNVEPQEDLPLISDIVTAYATHHSHVAFDDKKGSWLIQAIKNAFLETLPPPQSKRIEVMGMLTKANNKVSRRCCDEDAMSNLATSLRKKFYLYPKSNSTDGNREANK